MLSSKPFYYKLLRKYVILFGNLFNSITVVRYASKDNNNTEVTRFKVPLIYAPKDKFVTRLNSDPDLFKDVQNILPRMSFEITGISYDPSRKQNSLLRVASAESSARVASQYMGVPYDISFELNLYAKTIDDGAHIVEQILPYFNPDYTVTINPVAEVGFLKDIPVILNNVVQSVQYEGGQDSVRYVYWTLNFNVKGYFFGPISQPKIIRKAIANIFNDPSLVTGNVIRINTDRGNNGTFQIGDIIYQGSSYQSATAYAFVNEWNWQNQRLVIGGAQGQFKVNSTIKAASTNASYNIASFDASPLKLVRITVEPDPLDAEPEDDFGYSVSIDEWGTDFT
jgi:hypothetical protein